MAIDLDELFETIGRFGRLLLEFNEHQAALPALLEDLVDQYDSTPLRDVIAPTIAAGPSIVGNVVAAMPTLQAAAQATLLRTVAADNPAAASTLAAALAEVIRQMKAGPETVERSTVGLTRSALSPFAGNGVLVTSAVRADGLPAELIVAEPARVACTADSYGGGATAGAEPFQFTGAAASSSVWAYDWPAGSGAAAALTALRPAAGLLTNSGFDTYTTANVPDSWTIADGTAGTNVLREATTVYDADGAAVKWVGGATQISLTQPLAAAALTQYAVALWVRVDVVPAAGVLTVELVDGSNANVADQEGTANSFTVDLTGLAAATWTSVTGVFRTPRALPSTLKVRLRLSTAMSSGSNLFIDRMTLAGMTTPYAGGPAVAVFSGATPFAQGDGWTVTATNDRGGASYGATFQSLFERLFGMAALGLALPSDGSPTLADTLITS